MELDSETKAAAKPACRKEAVNNAEFKEKSYWEGRFEEEAEYDWLLKYSDVRQQLLPYISPSDNILVVGCGNSSFSADLYDDGFHNITNIDFSAVVINKMQADHALTRPSMQWVCMDMTDLQFPSSSFDIVLDKAAMDALVVDEGDVWSPNQEVIERVDKMSQSVSRVLRRARTHGKFIQISFQQPHFRTKYLIGSRITGNIGSLYTADKGYSSIYHWELLPHIVVEKESGCLNSFMYVMQTTVEH